MAWNVTAMDVRMAAALAQGDEDVAAFCRAQGISRQSYYKWKTRFECEVWTEDGNRVAIFARSTLIRAPVLDPTKTYQPIGPTRQSTHQTVPPDTSDADCQ
jgi:hypothetical protein